MSRTPPDANRRFASPHWGARGRFGAAVRGALWLDPLP